MKSLQRDRTALNDKNITASGVLFTGLTLPGQFIIALLWSCSSSVPRWHTDWNHIYCFADFLISKMLFLPEILTQTNPTFTSFISSNQITRAHYEDIIIKNGHCSQRIKLYGWCKCHGEFIIATSLYYYLIKKSVFVTGHYNSSYSLHRFP